MVHDNSLPDGLVEGTSLPWIPERVVDGILHEEAFALLGP